MQMTNIDTANAVALAPTIFVQLGGKLKVAPENVRAANKEKAEDLGGMADSLASEVGLINALVGYEEEGVHYVTAGRRRLLGLELLKKQKRLPAHFKTQGVRFTLLPKEIAIEVSLAENVQRENMSPRDELIAYRELALKDKAPSEIAAITGSKESRVNQLLSLTRVAEPVLNGFLSGAFCLDTLRAFTLTTSQERQIEVLEFCGNSVSAQRVRSYLTKEGLRGDDSVAVFVGKDAYEAAGGSYIVDLFSEGPSFWADSGLAQKLYDEKLAAEVEALRAEGWADVVVTDGHYGYQGNLTQIFKLDRDLTPEEQAQIEEIEARLFPADGTELSWGDRRDIQNELHALRSAFRVWTPEQMETGTVFVRVDYAGVFNFLGAYTQPAASSGSTALVKEKPAFGHEGHQRMTRIATTAVRNAVVADPAAAYDTMVAHQAWMMLRNLGDNGYALHFAKPGSDAPEGMSIKGDAGFEDAFAEWDERLPRTFLEFYPAVVALDADEKGRLLALCVAIQLNGLETRADYRRPMAWAQLGQIANRVDLQIDQCWTPDAEFLKGAGKKTLLTALTAMDMDPTPHEKDKKSVLVEIAARSAQKKKWVPELLAELTNPTLSDRNNEADKAAPKADWDDIEDDDGIDDVDTDLGTDLGIGDEED